MNQAVSTVGSPSTEAAEELHTGSGQGTVLEEGPVVGVDLVVVARRTAVAVRAVRTVVEVGHHNHPAGEGHRSPAVVAVRSLAVAADRTAAEVDHRSLPAEVVDLHNHQEHHRTCGTSRPWYRSLDR